MNEQIKKELKELLNQIAKELGLNIGETGVQNGQWIIVQDNIITISIDGQKREGESAVKKIKNYLEHNNIKTEIKYSNKGVINNFIINIGKSITYE